jgi:hypothetical protein
LENLRNFRINVIIIVWSSTINHFLIQQRNFFLETDMCHGQHISRLGGADSFYLPLNLLAAPVPFNVGPLQELPIAQRHQVWQRIVTRRYKQKTRDRRNNSPAVN